VKDIEKETNLVNVSEVKNQKGKSRGKKKRKSVRRGVSEREKAKFFSSALNILLRSKKTFFLRTIFFLQVWSKKSIIIFYRLTFSARSSAIAPQARLFYHIISINWRQKIYTVVPCYLRDILGRNIRH